MSSGIELEQRRTGWDVVVGILLVIAGIVILGHSVLATVVSIRFLGWMSLIVGIVVLVTSLVTIRRGATWSAALGGGLLAVLGVLILDNTAAAALTLTLIAGALFLVGGIVRLVMAAEDTEARWLLVLSGLASLVLGLIVLLNWAEASFTLLGVLLGVEAIVEGITLALVGRVRARVRSDGAAQPARS